MHNNLLIIAPMEEGNYYSEGNAIEKINKYLDEQNIGSLVSFGESKANEIFNKGKQFTLDLYGVAGKFVLGDKFIKFLETIEWALPDEVIIIYSQNSTGEEDYLGVWKPKKIKLKEL